MRRQLVRSALYLACMSAVYTAQDIDIRVTNRPSSKNSDARFILRPDYTSTCISEAGSDSVDWARSIECDHAVRDWLPGP
jgi:hypothetical protein